MAFTLSCSADDLEKLLSDQSSSSSHKGSSSSRGNNGGGGSSGGGTAGGTVKIGTQTWMEKNLDVAAAGSKCFDNDPANCVKYGRLYDWATAKTACPSGWHLPTQAEWNTLSSYIGSNKGCSGCDAMHLKSASGWSSGTRLDSYGFSALPGGCLAYGDFFGVGGLGGWWSATETNGMSSHAYFMLMYPDIEEIGRAHDDKSSLFSVRCLQN
jgi:uncharacterized protein (TIGR02145 family)